MKIAKRTFTVLSLCLLLCGVLSLVLNIVSSYALGALYNNGVSFLGQQWVSWVQYIIVLYCLSMPLCFLLMSRIPASIPGDNKLSVKEFFQFFLLCFPIMVAGSVIGNLLSAVFSLGHAENPVEQMAAYKSPLGIIVTVVLAPLFEELLFRKFLIDRTARYGEKTAILFSAITFGIFHGNFFQFFYAAGLGLVFAYIYTRTGKLRYTAIIHGAINLLGGVIAPFLLDKVTQSGILTTAADGDIAAVANSAGLPYLLLLALYLIAYYGLVAGGIVSLVIKLRHLKFESAEAQLQRGEAIKTVYLNAGFILLALFCAFEFVLNLIG